MSKNPKIQYTLRGIPEHVDRCLRENAEKFGKSLNETALEALASGLGLKDKPQRHHDLDDLAGSWVQDPAFDQAIKEMDRVDEDLWK